MVVQTAEHLEAPNWSRDGLSLVVNKGGLLYRVPVKGGELQRIDTGSAVKCNDDHGISPDGTLLAISDSTRPGGSQVYVLPITGGGPRPITQPGAGSSFWHGWSPDGRTLAFVGERNGDFDLYTIPVASADPGITPSSDSGNGQFPHRLFLIRRVHATQPGTATFDWSSQGILP